MKIRIYFVIASLLIILSGCSSSPDLPHSGTESPMQEETPFVSPIDAAVNFTDSVIEQAIRDLLQKPVDDITVADLLNITVLGDAEGNGGAFGDINGKITTLSDLKWLKNLTTLSLGDCGIKSLEGIDELTGLEILRLRRNDIKDLEPLRNLVKLKELDLSENPISDTSALSGLVNMEQLGLGNCSKIDLTCVSNMGILKSLYAAYSNITDISMLADKFDLDYLQLFHNNISDISALKNLYNLTYLDISLNNISDIDPLDGLLNLETVRMDNNPISEERIEAFYAPTENDFITREFRQKIGVDMPEYVFELSAFKTKRSDTYQTTKITLRNADSGEIIQEILPSDYTFDGMNVSLYGDDLGFSIEDMNFDDYADIRIVKFLPAAPNIPYVCWVWDENIGQYVYHADLSEITSIEVDYENELIHNFGRASASEHFEEYYRYIDGVLTMIKEVRTGFFDGNDPNQGYSITHEWIDEQWVMTEKEKIEIGG